ncbi:MAG: hypothetical protein HY906_05960 [Deltaproteobacteria bacterium]|nr:hypothetical protein [Deltaproteobacteria bacterium]
MSRDEAGGPVVTCDWPGCERPACCTCADEEVELLLCEEHARPELRTKQANVCAALKLLKRVAAAARRGPSVRAK